jgi:hypothetical protein
MAHENEYEEKLSAARARAVADRREVTDALAKNYNAENMREAFVKLQSVIETIDRALADEAHIAAHPVSSETSGVAINAKSPNK